MTQEIEHEHRFLLTSEEARRFVAHASMHLHLDVHNATRPISYSRTTYFDTSDNWYWRSHLASINRRVRIRHYASAEDISSAPRMSSDAYLELKESSATTRRKLRHQSRAASLHKLITGTRLPKPDSILLGKDPELFAIAAQIATGELRPVLSTWYRRMSLSKGNLRLTIDENVAFSRPQDLSIDGTSAPQDVLGMISGRILEIKVSGQHPTWLATAMLELAGMESISKFTRGMEILRSPTRSALRATRPLAILATMRSRD